MAVTVSIRDLTPDVVSLQRTTMMQDLQDMLTPVAGNQPIIIRDVRPTDFNNGTLIGQLDTPVLTADTYNTDVYSSWTKLNSPTQLLGILGFANLSGRPILDELTFIASGQTLSINVIDQTYCNTVDSRVYFFPPLVWTFNEHVRIDMLSHAGGAAHLQPFQWVGLIAETQSVIVPPREIGLNKKVPGMI